MNYLILKEKMESLPRIAQHYIGERINMEQASVSIEARPEVFARLEQELDSAIIFLNKILTGEIIPSRANFLLVNTVKLFDRTNRPALLPTLAELKTKNDFLTLKVAITTYKRINVLMEQGEQEYPVQGSWVLHTCKNIDHDKLVAATMIAVYGEFIRTRFSGYNLRGFEDIVLPLEEILAAQFPDSYMFQLFREWYILDEGFTPELVKQVERSPIILLPNELQTLQEFGQAVDSEADQYQFGGSLGNHISAITKFQQYILDLTEKYGLTADAYIGWHRQFLVN
jgi:hypothetical protein